MEETNQDEIRLYDELKSFLVSDRVDLRLAASEAVWQQVCSCSNIDDNDNDDNHDKKSDEIRKNDKNDNNDNNDNINNNENNKIVSSSTSTTSSSSHNDYDHKLLQFDIIQLVAKNCSYPDLLISIYSLKSLVRLTSQSIISDQITYDLLHKYGGMNRMIEIILSTSSSSSTSTSSTENKEILWRRQVNYAMSLLANMTRTEEGAVEMAGRIYNDEAIVVVVPPLLDIDQESTTMTTSIDKLPPKPTLDLILSRYLNESYIIPYDYEKHIIISADSSSSYDNIILDSHNNDPYQHFASILMNIAQVEQGRQFLLRIHRRKNSITNVDEEITVLQKILYQLRSNNPIRRRGTAGTIKNCVLDRDSIWWLMNVVKILKHILYPLSGPEELDLDDKQGLDPDLWLEGPDKQREIDHDTRLYLVDTILILCHTGRRETRELLRLQRVYVILKWADMVEICDDINEIIYECVNYLRGDEPGSYEGSSDKFVENSYNRIITTQSTTLTTTLALTTSNVSEGAAIVTPINSNDINLDDVD